MRKGVGTPGVKKASEVESLASHAANPAAHPDYMKKRDLTNLKDLSQHLADRYSHVDDVVRRQELVFTKADFEATKNAQLSTDPTNYKSNNPKRHVLTTFVLNQILADLGIASSSSLVRPADIIKPGDVLPTSTEDQNRMLLSYGWLQPKLTQLTNLAEAVTTLASALSEYETTTAPATFLSKTDAEEIYLSQALAGTTYLSKTDAQSTYLAKVDAGALVFDAGTVADFADANNGANATTNVTVTALKGKLNQYHYDLVVEEDDVQYVNPILKRFIETKTISITVTTTADGDLTGTYNLDQFAYLPLNTGVLYGTGADDEDIAIPIGTALLATDGSQPLTSTSKVLLVATPLHATIEEPPAPAVEE